jgi:hypothetical protein
MASSPARIALSVAQTGRPAPFAELLRSHDAHRRTNATAAAANATTDVDVLKVVGLLGGHTSPAHALRRVELDGLKAVPAPRMAEWPTTQTFLRSVLGGPGVARDERVVGPAIGNAHPPWQVIVASPRVAPIAPELVDGFRRRNADVFIAQEHPEDQREQVRRQAARHLVLPFSALFHTYASAMVASSSTADQAVDPAATDIGAGIAAQGRLRGLVVGMGELVRRELDTDMRRRLVSGGPPRPGEVHSRECEAFASAANTLSLLPFSMEARLLGGQTVGASSDGAAAATAALRMDAEDPWHVAATVRLAVQLGQLVAMGSSAGNGPAVSVAVGLTANEPLLRAAAAAARVPAVNLERPTKAKVAADSQRLAETTALNAQRRITLPSQRGAPGTAAGSSSGGHRAQHASKFGRDGGRGRGSGRDAGSARGSRDGGAGVSF